MYTAVVINTEDRLRLVKALEEVYLAKTQGFQFCTGRGDILPHHMTLHLGSFLSTLNPSSVLGAKTEMIIDGFCWDEKIGVCAARVARAVARPDNREFTLKSTNDYPHITMCLKPGSKPMLSNQLPWTCEENVVAIQPFSVFGMVQECH